MKGILRYYQTSFVQQNQIAPNNKDNAAMYKTKPASFLPIAMFCAFCVVVMMSAILWPRGSYMLVVAPLFSSPAATMAIIDTADGAFIQQGRTGWIAIAYSEQPDFVARLRSAGALLVLRSPLLGSCMTIAATR